MSPTSVRFHVAARRELRKSTERYDEQLSGLGDEFAGEVQQAVRLITVHPEAGSRYTAGTRRVLVRRFPYSLIYRARDGELVIFAVAHHRRRPGYWLRRV